MTITNKEDYDILLLQVYDKGQLKVFLKKLFKQVTCEVIDTEAYKGTA